MMDLSKTTPGPIDVFRSIGVISIVAVLGACSANGGAGQTTTTVLPASPNVPAVSLALSPASIKEGETATATWSSSDATSCRGTGGWSGTLALSNSTGATLGPIAQSGTYTYGVSCSGAGGTANATQSLTVGDVPHPDIQFQISPAAVKPGDSANLTWSTANATSCAGTGGRSSDGWAAAQPTSNEAGFNTGVISTAGQYTYNLSCTGPGGTSEQTRTLTVDASSPAAPPSISFQANPTFMQPGQSSKLSWTSSNATSCSASGGAGSDGWSGSQPTSSSGITVGPIQTAGSYSYTLTCTGAGGSSSNSVTIVVSTSTVPPPVTVDIAANPTHIVAGGSAALTWSTTNANTCSASGSWSGSKPLMASAVSTGTLWVPGVYSYTLTCSGSGGAASNSATASLTVDPPTASIPLFAAAPTSTQTGQSITLNWATLDATSCTASGGSGSDGWTGTVATVSAATLIGPLNTAGTYTYKLTCTGPGGTSAPSSVVVTVSAVAPPVTIPSLILAPTTILVGQSTTLTWATLGATACAASGGSGSDGWTGSVPTVGVGLLIGPINTAGTYTYTLNCTGPGGASAPSSAVLNVDALPAPPVIQAFTAVPATLIAGQSTLLSWASIGATACTATGGTGSDGWSGPMPTFSVAMTVGPINTAGSYTYKLTCTGPGGTSATTSVIVTVNAATPGQPTVTLTANDANPAQIKPGLAPTLKWSSTNATSCTASGGTGSDGWSGTQPISSLGFTAGPVITPGVYSYTLTCTGSGGSGSSTVALTVISSPTADCGIGEPSTMMLAPAVSAFSSEHGLCLAGCTVTNLSNVTDANANNFASMSVALGVAATVSLGVTDSTTTYPAGRTTGFLMADPNALLSAALLQNVTVVTSLKGTVQETATSNDILELKALGLLNNPDAAFVEFKTKKPFDTVRVDLGSLVSAASHFNVYGACVSLQ